MADDELNYSKRELDHFLSEITTHLTKQDELSAMQYKDLKEDLGQVKVQTTKTNGRVSKLELWNSILRWSFGAMVVVIVTISPVLWYFIKLQVKQTTADAAQKAVISALAQYNITVQQ